MPFNILIVISAKHKLHQHILLHGETKLNWISLVSYHIFFLILEKTGAGKKCVLAQRKSVAKKMPSSQIPCDGKQYL
jgi:hypothetical protein